LPKSSRDSSFGRAFTGAACGEILSRAFAVLAGLRRDRPMKLGLHPTLSEIGLFHVTAACGFARDRFMGSGAFGMMETSIRF
jgi:hypothetical protein